MNTEQTTSTVNQGPETVELDQAFIVLMVPEDTVELDITARIYQDHKLTEVTRHMDFPEVRDAIRDGERNYLPEDAMFVLAPTRREKMAALLEKYAADEDEE